MREKLSKINNKWVRLLAMTVVFINISALSFGYEFLPFDNETIVAGISVIALGASEIWNHWKNNSYTREAEEADRILARKKNNKE